MGTAQLQCATDSRPLAICGFTDAAQGPAHRWGVAGMEEGNKPPSSPSWQSPCQEVHRQNLVLPSLLADKVRHPLRSTVQFDRTRIQSLYQIFIIDELPACSCVPLFFKHLVHWGKSHLLGCYEVDRKGPKFVCAHNSLVLHCGLITNCRIPFCPTTPSALVSNGYCTASVCHRFSPTGHLWLH